MIRSHAKLKFLGPLAVILLAWSNPARADIIYGVTGAGGHASTLYSESYATGGTPTVSGLTQVGSGPIALASNGDVLSLAGIAYANGTLYGVTNSMSSSTINGNGSYVNSLVTISASTGQATLVNTTPNAPYLGVNNTQQVQSLAFDSYNGNLYGTSINGVGSGTPASNSLVMFNLAAGTASQVGSGMGLSFSTSGNGLGFNASGNGYYVPNGTSSDMYSVNASAGTAADSGVGFTGAPYANMKALAFDSSGNLYGINFSSSSTSDLVALAPPGSSWSVTNLGTTPGGAAGYTTSAFVGITFASVPEPGSQLLTGLPVIGVGLWCWARRRRARLAAS